ncbi:MAG: LysR family transcriptional regulator [Woeseia sp.]|nr:LysR family transcriptional regulator [Woeseia sp.]NNL55286.1 LysR family transcriptional regulator [Woeseia sp.]
MRGIRTFCAAARHQSFKLAADELFITASAVSHQVRKLESELAVDLFQRDGRSISLTEAGSQLFKEAGNAIDVIDEMVGKLRGEHRRSSLRVSVQPFFASEFLVPNLGKFTGANPTIDLQIDTTDESRERHPESADVSIRLFSKAPAGLSSDLLFPLRLVPACSPEFREQLDIVGWRVSNAMTMIVNSKQPNAWKAWSDNSGIKVPKSSNFIRFDSMLAVARAAEQGLGAALVPMPLASEWFETQRLVRLFDYELVTDHGYYIAFKSDEGQRSDILALREWVLKAFENER